jgi:hypothetical protein
MVLTEGPLAKSAENIGASPFKRGLSVLDYICEAGIVMSS